MKTEEIIAWLAELFNESPSDLGLETLREDIPEWDSLGVLTLMAEMDEKFDIVLSNDDVANMSKIGDVVALLQKHDKIAS